MIGETVSLWLLSLPTWGTITWLVVMGILYGTGIDLSRRYKTQWFLVMSFTAVLMSFAYMNAQILGARLGDNPLASLIKVIVAAVLIIAMVAWSSPQKSDKRDAEVGRTSD